MLAAQARERQQLAERVQWLEGQLERRENVISDQADRLAAQQLVIARQERIIADFYWRLQLPKTR